MINQNPFQNILGMNPNCQLTMKSQQQRSLQHLDDSTLGLIFSYLPLNQLVFLSESGLDLVCRRFFRVLHMEEGVLLNLWRRLYMREYEKSSLCPTFSYRELAHYVLNNNDERRREEEQHDALLEQIATTTTSNEPGATVMNMIGTDNDDNDDENMDNTTRTFRSESEECSTSCLNSLTHNYDGPPSHPRALSSQVFRWLLANLIGSRDRVSMGVEMRENFSLVTPLLSAESRHVPTCFSVCNVLNRCVEFIGIGTFDYKLQVYVRDYGEEFLKGFHRKRRQSQANKISMLSDRWKHVTTSEGNEETEEDEEVTISASSLINSDSKYRLVDKTIPAHYDEITCIRFLNSQYFSHTPRYYHGENQASSSSSGNSSSSSGSNTHKIATTNGGTGPSLLMITGSKDKTIKVWKIEFSPPSAQYLSSSWNTSESSSSSHETVCSPSMDFHIKCIATLSSHTDWIRDVIPISKHPDKLVSISRDKSIKIWSLNTMQLKHSIQPNNLVWCMADHVDKGLLITASTSGELIFYDVHTGHMVHHMKPHKDLITKVLYIPTLPAVSSHNDVQTCRRVTKFQSPPLMITCSYDKSISVINANNFERLVHIDEAHSTPIFSISVHGQRLTSSSVDGCVKNWILSNSSSSITGNIVELQASMEQSLIGYKLPQELGGSRGTNIFDLNGNVNRQVKVVSSVRSNSTEDIIISNNDAHNYLCVWTSKHHKDMQLIRYPLPDVVLNPKNHYSIQQLLKVLPSEIIVKDFTICGNRIICLLEFVPTESTTSNRSNAGNNGGRAHTHHTAQSVFMQKRGCVCMWQL
nr:unnamed protein product [Naegleria fowleri]